MKKFFYKSASLLCILSLFTLLVPVNAAALVSPSIQQNLKPLSSNEVDILLNEYDKMSAEELNEIISNAKQQMEDINSPSSRYGFLERAWLAAAKLVEPDYPCAAKLVEYSVKGYNYTENESAGLFGRKIINTDAYANWRTNCGFNTPAKSIEFAANDNSDLYYALHLANIKVASISMYGASIEVTDVFDFDVAFMGSIFATIVNDWAWLCQQTGVLNVIDVKILFNDSTWDGYTK